MPPTTLTIYILLALCRADLEPREIYEQIAVDSQSTVLALESSFYKALRRLVGEELLEDLTLNGGGRRYHLTGRGRRILGQESVRVRRLALLLGQRTGEGKNYG